MPQAAHPYDRPSDPAKRHSAALTDGPDRAAARAMLKAIGFTDEDLAKPLVGVATTWIETMPCNYNQRRLAEHVKAGIRAAGGTPMEFNTISVSDGVSMGTEGMKASLISREVVADSIELVVRGHLLDGVVCLVGCDKTIPGAAMALGRLDVPGLVLYNGTIYPGRLQGPAQRDRRDRVRGDRGVPRGQDHARRAVRGRERRVPRRRRLRWPVHGQHDVDGHGVPRALARRPQRHPGRGPGQGRGRAPVRRDRHGPRPRRRPAVAVRHPRRARERDRVGRRDRRLHQRRPPPAGDRARVRDPARHRRVRGDRRPDADRRRHGAGRPLHRLRHVRRGRPRARHARAAQAPGLAPRRRAHGRRPDHRRDRGGRRRDARPAGRRAARDAAQADRRPGDPARLARARWLRRQARRPRAAAPSRAGPRLRLGDRVLRRRPRPADRARRRRRHPLRGSGRRSRDAGDAERHRRRSSARGSATRSRSSPTAGSPAAPTG